MLEHVAGKLTAYVNCHALHGCVHTQYKNCRGIHTVHDKNFALVAAAQHLLIAYDNIHYLAACMAVREVCGPRQACSSRLPTNAPSHTSVLLSVVHSSMLYSSMLHSIKQRHKLLQTN